MSTPSERSWTSPPRAPSHSRWTHFATHHPPLPAGTGAATQTCLPRVLSPGVGMGMCVLSRQRLVLGSGTKRASTHLRHTAALPEQSSQRGSSHRTHFPPTRDSEAHLLHVCASVHTAQPVPHCAGGRRGATDGGGPAAGMEHVWACLADSWTAAQRLAGSTAGGQSNMWHDPAGLIHWPDPLLLSWPELLYCCAPCGSGGRRLQQSSRLGTRRRCQACRPRSARS